MSFFCASTLTRGEGRKKANILCAVSGQRLPLQFTIDFEFDAMQKYAIKISHTDPGACAAYSRCSSIVVRGFRLIRWAGGGGDKTGECLSYILPSNCSHCWGTKVPIDSAAKLSVALLSGPNILSVLSNTDWSAQFTTRDWHKWSSEFLHKC